MTTASLSTLSAGFSDESLGSQHVFRCVLEALSHPGRAVRVEHDAGTPTVGHSASAAVLLALLDSECSLWLSPRLADGDAGQWLRFHTGCTLAADAADARFAWVAAGDAVPQLAALQQGSDPYPDQSATCVIDVHSMAADEVVQGESASVMLDEASEESVEGLQLTGPGIEHARLLRVAGLPANFTGEWAANHAVFPRGVDLLLATATHVAGLPRTTRVKPATPATPATNGGN